MNIFKIFRKLYIELFSFAFDGEYDLDRTFNTLENWHDRALPDSENKLEATYAKVCKSQAFFLFSPIIFLFLKFQFMKYSSSEYLQSIINKSIDNNE
ncbi:hypothetical protein [Flavobacterium sp. HNIBRBA15423]|uniref:hypothetical protein n=1 Tax=Flavobacterium sp. HNIBRBA15423 TaxID=3458683 RepID=UPI0040444AE0